MRGCGIDPRSRQNLFSHPLSKQDSLRASKTEMFYQVGCANLRSRKTTTFSELNFYLDSLVKGQCGITILGLEFIMQRGHFI